MKNGIGIASRELSGDVSVENSTVHGQGSRVAGAPSLVGRRARVLPRVSRGHRLDAEDAILSRCRQDVYV